MDSDINNSRSYATSKKNILNFIRPRSNDAFKVRHPKELIFLTRLRAGLSYLREHNFKHNFLDALNPICICGFYIETLHHFFPHRPDSLMKDKTFCLRLKGSSLIFLEKLTLACITSILLYGDSSFPANLTPTHSLHLLTTFYPQEV